MYRQGGWRIWRAAEGAGAVAGILLASTAAAADGPARVAAGTVVAGDTAWLMTATALVLLMTLPGLAMFYAGMVRKKNVLATALHSLAICCLVTLLWVCVGYSLAFTPGSPFIGGLDRLFLQGLGYFKDAGELTVSHIAPSIPESVFVSFQLTFAIITPALIAGAFAERMRFGAMMLFMAAWSLLVYAPVAHWVWEPTGWLAQLGVLDFAGGAVVHINAGAAALACAFVVGPRRGYGREPFMPYNLALTMIGTHGIGGLVGAVLTGVFASTDIGGAHGDVLLTCPANFGPSGA